MRIISLLPSTTEMVCLLGRGTDLVGVSHECDHPPAVRSLPRVTRPLVPQADSSRVIDEAVRRRLTDSESLYALDQDLIERLQPDLIITQELCEVCAVSEKDVRRACRVLPAEPEVVTISPTTLEEVFQAMRQLGSLLSAAEAADNACGALAARVRTVSERAAATTRRPRVAFLEWLDPPFAAGHWNPQLIGLAGGVDLLGRPGEPSREVRWSEVSSADPDVVFVASCGLDDERTMREIAALAAAGTMPPSLLNGIPWLVSDGSQYFNRPGPRLVDSLEILAHGLDPDTHPLPAGLAGALPMSFPAGNPAVTN